LIGVAVEMVVEVVVAAAATDTIGVINKTNDAITKRTFVNFFFN